MSPLTKPCRSKISVVRTAARRHRTGLVALVVIIAHTMGAWASVQAIMNTRTPQAAVAWALALNLFPYGAVPLYWAFGHTDPDGYVMERRADSLHFKQTGDQVRDSIASAGLAVEQHTRRGLVLPSLGGFPFTRGNQLTLLIDGADTYDSIFQAVDTAESYILVQFYIIRDDPTGERLKDKLIAQARRGVRVYVLYDQLGSLSLGSGYRKDLAAAGVRVFPFSTKRDYGRKYQLNFRNHRKLVVVDGKTGFIGGLNIGDEYLGNDETFTPWRDTHLRAVGPVVQQMQLSFSGDWFWASREMVSGLDWNVSPSGESDPDVHALFLATGPADPLETCSLVFLTAINRAETRLWIATPYFVPDSQIISALQLAALRGVDVRILIPGLNDSKLVHYSSFSYLPEIDVEGIKVFRYQNGFLHQKVILVDDDFAGIGSANLDNRSFRLMTRIARLLAPIE